MSVIQSDLLLGAPPATGYTIQRSLRFNSADSAYLSRTPSSAGNRKTWTWSGWVKRSGLSRNYDELFGNADGTGGTAATTLFFASDNTLYFQALSASNTYALVTSQAFRDASAWYHIVAVADTTNTTSTDRLRLYVNGSRVTAFATANYPPLNFDTFINQSGVAHYLGRMFLNSYFNGYLADVHFIDGQALDPTSFGQFDANNVWQPKAFSGTYGSQGWKLDFSDNSNNTATTLGKDSSGNNNNWTPVNLSVGPGGNTSQNWSATASIAGQAGFEATKAFDGDASSVSSTYYFPGANGTGTFTFPQSVAYSTIKIWYGRNNGRLFVNGVDMAVSSTTYAELDEAYLASKGVTSPLVSIGLERTSSGNGAYLFGVQVNGSQLVDPIYGASNDSLRDSPTNGSQTDTGAGGEVSGNYCTLNPLAGSGSTLSNGNLDITATNAGSSHYKSTIATASGKWYFEATLTSGASSTDALAGVSTIETAPGTYPGQVSTSYVAYAYNANSYLQKVNNGAFTNLSATTFATNDILGVAVDLDNGKIWFSKNGVWTDSGNPGTGANAAFTGLSGTFTPVFRGSGAGGSSGWNVNFGQRPFAYTAPSGFKALCTANIPEGTITTSGSFTGNANADGPFVWLNGVPTAMSINGNAVTFGTHADKLANGFKVRSSSSSYNTAGSNTYSITTTGAKFKNARAQANP